MNAYETDISNLLALYNHSDCLIYGIGNIGRQDDGLGWAIIDWLEDTGLCNQAELVRRYQLQLEDADLIRSKCNVLFVDATKSENVQDVALETMHPKMDSSFTSHSVSIATIMAACQTCFNRVPEVKLLTIKGYQWQLKIGLSEQAIQNLEKAKILLQDFSKSRRETATLQY